MCLVVTDAHQGTERPAHSFVWPLRVWPSPWFLWHGTIRYPLDTHCNMCLRQPRRMLVLFSCEVLQKLGIWNYSILMITLHTDWETIARLIEKHYWDYEGFVVIHGTDTMAVRHPLTEFWVLMPPSYRLLGLTICTLQTVHSVCSFLYAGEFGQSCGADRFTDSAGKLYCWRSQVRSSCSSCSGCFMLFSSLFSTWACLYKRVWEWAKETGLLKGLALTLCVCCVCDIGIWYHPWSLPKKQRSQRW